MSTPARTTRATQNYKDLKKSLRSIYHALFPEASPKELKMYVSALNNPVAIHASVNYFEKVVIGNKTNSNLILSKRIAKLKKKLNID